MRLQSPFTNKPMHYISVY